MRKFEDKNNNLTWLCEYNLAMELLYDYKLPEEIENAFSEISTWRSRNLKKFIMDKKSKTDLATMFKNIILSYNDYEDPNTFQFFAYNDDNLVGTINASIDNRHNHLHINIILTNPKFYKKGIATRLIKSVQENPAFFGKRGITQIVQYVENKNKAARKLCDISNFELDENLTKSDQFLYYRYHTQTHEK